ncbi:Ribosomal-protein-alanine N-acetyltransferase [Adhaeribacter pallidiroseus]|uniref:Ribosomal-protein-alanine N-acetyltransferase n=2 Tax=Adhaeribacter pallidiroseus TaxID=2072847 RepID=A0A369QHN2_9BACT|nr:Ribosomal-protein-alanine N-acetyltransferase [Adhaeribacter pallidiroseus]
MLRLVELTDLSEIHHLHSLPETDAFNTLGIPGNSLETEVILKKWISDQQQLEIKNYTFLVEHTTTQQFIGLIALVLGNPKFQTGRVWYKLHPSHWNQGFATEALNSVLNFGFEDLKLHRIEAGCAVDNIGSRKVLEKVGMSLEGRKRQVLPLKSGWSDNWEYAILETDARLPRATTSKKP